MSEITNTNITETVEVPQSKAKRVFRTVSWIFLGLLLLIVFTLLKLPDDRLKSYVQGSVSAALATKGITLESRTAHLGFGVGISYVMNDVTLRFPPPDAPVHIDKIEVSPSILPLLIGWVGGKLWLRNGDGKMMGSFSMKGSQISVSFDASKLDLGKIGLLPIAAGIKAGAVMNGEGVFSGDINEPRSDAGKIDLQLDKIVLDQQSIQGFPIPRVTISEGKFEISIENGKAVFRTVRLGKSDADDIRATLTGDLTLGKTIDISTINAKTTLSLSQNLLKSIPLLDMILTPGKQPDGGYAFDLTGPLSNINPAPAGAK